jgi:hypothetical protein
MSAKPAAIREIAQSICDHLNGTDGTVQSWAADYPSLVFTRSYWTNYAIADADPTSAGKIRGDVFLTVQDFQAESRGQDEYDYGYSIVIQQKLANRTVTANVDKLIDLVSAVADNFSPGKNFLATWRNNITYPIGSYVIDNLDGNTYRGLLGANIGNQPSTSVLYWAPVNPVQVVEKHNGVVYAPQRGDTTNIFESTIEIMVRQDR